MGRRVIVSAWSSVVLLVSAIVLAGCETGREEIRFEPARVETPEASTPPPRAQHPRRPQPIREPNLELAVGLDFEILQFTAQNRRALDALVGRGRSAGYWPESVRVPWSRIIVAVEDALARPPGDFPSPLLMRGRITINSELDEAERRLGQAPAEIRSGIVRVRALLDKHIRSPDTPKDEPPATKIALVWPVSSHLVTSPFGRRRDPIIEEGAVRNHAGIDVAAASGEVVKAAAPGRVLFSGWTSGGGNTVMVSHPHGYVSMYAHLEETLVKAGAFVAQGTAVGVAGNTGRSTGAHLHFEVRRGGVAVDPEELLPPH
jgi:murein DD-endopeptidase MepM/ murein hydrolase activator NlpD